MPQINKVIREKDIKQASRKNGFKPANNRNLIKIKPKPQDSPKKDLEQTEEISKQTPNTQVQAAKKASLVKAGLSETKSQKNSVQESIENSDSIACNQVTNTAYISANTAVFHAQQINKHKSSVNTVTRSEPDLIYTAPSGIKHIDPDIKKVQHTPFKTAQASKSAAIRRPKHKLRNHGKRPANNAHKGKIVDSSLNTPFKAAQKASIAALRHAKTLSESSDKSADQEAVDKTESFAGSVLSDAEDIVSGTGNSLRRQIRKRSPDIKNKKDIKAGTRTIRKADSSFKTIEKSAADSTKAVQKSAVKAAKQTVIASQKIAYARKTETLAKKSAELVKKIVKGIIDALKKLVSALGASSIPLLLILVLASLICGIVASSFGIFFAGEASGEDTRTLQEVLLEINAEFTETIKEIEDTVNHDELIIEGYQAPWREVLAVYAVYVTTKADGAMDVIHLTDEHIEILKDIFWMMNTITYTTEEETKTVQVPKLDENGEQKTDEDGNPIYTEEQVTIITLRITINTMSAFEAAEELYFNAEQMAELNELLDEKYDQLWDDLLKGVGQGSNELVRLALSQLGNEGGEKFWSWAGLDERCPWCALFVSWCADQLGMISSGQIPFFSFVSDGVDWFVAKGKWIYGSEVNSSNCDKLIQPGMLIFFDWEPDGSPNHVGIVTKVEGGYIYTVEGNKSDAVAEGRYSADSYAIYGFGIVG